MRNQFGWSFWDQVWLSLSVAVLLQSAWMAEQNSRPHPREDQILQRVALPRSYRHVFRAALPETCVAAVGVE